MQGPCGSLSPSIDMKRHNHRKLPSDAHDAGDELSDNDVKSNEISELSDASETSEASDRSVSQSIPRKRLKHERDLLLNIPNSNWYCRSYMHKAYVSLVDTFQDIVASGSVDGVVKLWKRAGDSSLELVAQFQAHDNIPVKRLCFSLDGKLVASVSDDQTVKIYSVSSADIVAIIELPSRPLCLCAGPNQTFIVSESRNSSIYIVNPRDFSKKKCSDLHMSPVSQMAYNIHYKCVVSADINGIIEYWQPESPTCSAPTNNGLFEYKSDTDLYCLRKAGTRPLSLSLSSDGTRFAMFSADFKIRVLDFLSGKLIATFDESIPKSSQAHEIGKSVYQPEDYDNRVIVEKQVEQVKGAMRKRNVIFDTSGNFVIYSTLLGIKVVNVVSQKCRVLLGKDEQVRFLNLALSVEGSAPMLFATGFRKNRVYLFKYSHEPMSQTNRDVQNEKVENTEPAPIVDTASEPATNDVGKDNIVTLHTSAGDILLELYPEIAPKAVENFVKHCIQEYYDGTKFHRIVHGFMIQAGKPTDGGEGVSIWGGHFDDEIDPDYKHDKAFVLSMANSGPGTNASQFYITTAPAPWLDGKHTVFGTVIKGQDVVTRIENTETDRNDCPINAPVIISTNAVQYGTRG